MRRPSLTFDQLSILYYKVRDLTHGLPHSSLTPVQLRDLGGWIFPGCDVIVEQLAKSLIDEAHLFPELAGKGEELLERLRAADGRKANYFMHRFLMDRDWNCYAEELAGLTKESFAILKDLKAKGEQPPAPAERERHYRRAAALIGVYVLVHVYYSKLRTIRKSLKDARRKGQQAQQGPQPPQGPAPQVPRSRQKIQAERALSEQVTEQIRQIFRELTSAVGVDVLARRLLSARGAGQG